MASGNHKGVVALWNPVTGKFVTAFRAHKTPVTSLTFSPNGKLLASTSKNKTIKVWDVSQVD
ncbi:MAG: WD40 repeat domain-containing protein [Gemmataceae bacterium]